MKTFTFFLKTLFLIFLVSCTCSVTMYNDINDYKGSVVKNIKVDSVGLSNDTAYRVLIKMPNGDFKTLLINKMIGETLQKNDTL